MGCHFLLQGIIPTQGSNLCLLGPPALAGRFFTTNATWETLNAYVILLCMNSNKIKVRNSLCKILVSSLSPFTYIHQLISTFVAPHFYFFPLPICCSLGNLDPSSFMCSLSVPWKPLALISLLHFIFNRPLWTIILLSSGFSVFPLQTECPQVFCAKKGTNISLSSVLKYFSIKCSVQKRKIFSRLQRK